VAQPVKRVTGKSCTKTEISATFVLELGAGTAETDRRTGSNA